MLDIKFVRAFPASVRQDLEKRGDKEKQAWFEDLLKKDELYRRLLQETEALRADRNKVSKAVSEAKKAGADASSLLAAAAAIPGQIKEKEEQAVAAQEQVRFYLMRLPNVLHESVPVGKTGDDNVVVRSWGNPRQDRTKSHVDILEPYGLADLERATKTSGSRFYFLKNELVLLDYALMRYGLDFLWKRGFQLIEPPYMMLKKPYEGVTDLADFENVMYKIEGEDLYLIATSEHPMGAMHQNEIFEPDQLPLKYAGVSACFRKEAGAHGKDTKGIFRVHQFNKIEQFIFSKPEDSWKLHEELLKNAESFFQSLELPYRIVNICTGDIGTVAAKKYDLEVWMPAQQTYREAVSCSNCTAYQATRLNIKYRLKPGSDEKEWLHTLNSTLVATSRAIVAIIENNQQADGAITVPKVLHPYTGGMTEIKPKK